MDECPLKNECEKFNKQNYAFTCYNPRFVLDNGSKSCELFIKKEVKQKEEKIIDTTTNVISTTEVPIETKIETVNNTKEEVNKMGKGSRLGLIKQLLKEGKSVDEVTKAVLAEFPDAKPGVVKGQIYSASRQLKGGSVKKEEAPVVETPVTDVTNSADESTVVEEGGAA